MRRETMIDVRRLRAGAGLGGEYGFNVLVVKNKGGASLLYIYNTSVHARTGVCVSCSPLTSPPPLPAPAALHTPHARTQLLRRYRPPYRPMHILHRCTRHRTFICAAYIYIHAMQLWLRGGGRRQRRRRGTCVIKFILSKTSAILSRRI